MGGGCGRYTAAACTGACNLVCFSRGAALHRQASSLQRVGATHPAPFPRPPQAEIDAGMHALALKTKTPAEAAR